MADAFVVSATALAFVCFMVFLAGFVDASAGGGALIAIPAYLFTGMPAHCALGSNKLSSACGTTLSVVKFWRSGAVEPRSAAIAFAASFAGSALGAHIALLLSDAAIKTALLVILPCVALVVLFKRNFGEEGGAREISKRRAVLLSAVIGLLIGGMLPFVFSALTMDSVSKAAYSMIEEVRRQFRTIPGIMEGTAKPDYKSCVAISTTSALKEMLVPGVMAVLAPLAVGLLLGTGALGGMLAGALVTGVLMAIFMSNAGGAWDNAKKYIEDGNHGGKGSEAHKAAVVGDTVGDPFKDTSGPSINILIKLMTVVSLVFASIFSASGLL